MLYILLFFSCAAWGQGISKGKLTGKYIGLTMHGYTVLKIKHSNHFKERGLLYWGWIIKYGKWEILNDTILLIKKAYRDKPFDKLKKDRIDTSRFILYNDTLRRLYENKGKKTLGQRYMTNKQWKKYLKEDK
ncbi:MAG TPA: hypothetical protein VF411_01210 [Bacteroidia bacterium]